MTGVILTDPIDITININKVKAIQSSSLKLEGVFLLPVEHLVKVLEHIPNHVTTLNLSYSALGYRKSDELIQICKAIPKHLSHLMFDDNCLSLQGSELQNILPCLPPTVTLDLSNNQLGEMNALDLGSALKSIKNTSRLILRCNKFELLSHEILGNLLSTLDKKVQHLALVFNFRKTLTPTVLKPLPKTITSLCLSLNYLGEYNKDELEALFQAVSNVLHLDISGNLFNKEGNSFEKKFSPALLSIFARSCFYKPEKLIQFLKALPDTLVYLDLRNNRIDSMSQEDLKAVFAALPPRTLVRLSTHSFMSRSEESINQLKADLGKSEVRIVKKDQGLNFLQITNLDFIHRISKPVEEVAKKIEPLVATEINLMPSMVSTSPTLAADTLLDKDESKAVSTQAKTTLVQTGKVAAEMPSFFLKCLSYIATSLTAVAAVLLFFAGAALPGIVCTAVTLIGGYGSYRFFNSSSGSNEVDSEKLTMQVNR